MTETIIKLDNVEKSFGVNKVLKGLDIDIKKGEVFGLLGHNGAGKTTILRIILGLLGIENGQVTVLDKEPTKVGEDIRKKCGVLSEDVGLYESLTVYDNLKFFAKAFNCYDKDFDNKIDALLERFKILENKNDIVRNFSLGMKKKVAIVRTLFHEPEIVLMDEPTNGLDPISINELMDIMREMVEKNGTTFILTTHNLDIVSKICDRVVIIKDGKNAFDRYMNDDVDLVKTHIEYINKDNVNVLDIIKEFNTDGNLVAGIKDGELELNVKDKEIVGGIVLKLALANCLVYSVKTDSMDLNKIYTKTDSEVE